MPRYALKVEYHGAPFVGWQRQPDQPSVQVPSRLLWRNWNRAPIPSLQQDAPILSVHGLAQVAHCDMDKDWDPFRLSEAINYHLKPAPVAIVDCAAVDDDWHARFSALERKYLFRLLMRRAPLTHQNGLVWRVNHQLDVDAMREGAAHLLGLHDFTTFRSSICQAESPVKTLDALDIVRVETDWGRKRSLPCGRGRSCTTRCAVLSARWSVWAAAAGSRTTCAARLRRGTVRPVDRCARRRGCIWRGCNIPRTRLRADVV